MLRVTALGTTLEALTVTGNVTHHSVLYGAGTESPMSSTSTLTESAPIVKPTAVTHADGCDRCGYSNEGKGSRISEPFVQVTLPSGKDLLFCGHHAKAYEPVLAKTGAKVVDWSSTVNVKPSQSSANV